jgi:hypothetical protein
MSFPRFAARYRSEMRRPDPRHVIETLAAVAQDQAIHLGCFCADQTQCHRTLLQSLVTVAQASLPALPKRIKTTGRFASPACSMPEIED